MKSQQLKAEILQTSTIFGRNNEATVVFEGDRAYTDGRKIVLPSIPDGIEIPNEEVSALRGYLDHEAGHLRHSNFKVSNSVFDQYGEKSEENFTFGFLEDLYVENKVTEEYSGAKVNLKSMDDLQLPEELEALKGNKEFTDKPSLGGLGLATKFAGRQEYGSELNKEALEQFTPEMQEWAKKFAELAKDSPSSQYNKELLEAMKKLVESDPRLQSNPEDFEFEPSQEAMDGQPSSVEEANKSDQEATKNKQGEGQKSKADQQGKGKQTKDQGQAQRQEFLNELSEDIPGGSGVGYKDYEHDKIKGLPPYRVFTTRFDEVYYKGKQPLEKTHTWTSLQGGSVSAYESLKGGLTSAVNVMKSRIRRSLIAKEQRDWDVGREFGKLDVRRLVSGYQGSPAVYKQRKDREELDTSVILLVDLSGSMSGKKAQVAMEAAIAFAECLEGTAIKYEIVGFTNPNGASGDYYRDSGTYTRIENLKMVMFKAFNKPLKTARDTLSTIKECVGGGNTDRDAIQWCLDKLKIQPTRRKVLIVFSDGSPSNSTHNFQHSYAAMVDYTRQIVEYAETVGVECLGIGIQDSSVKNIYKNNVVINNVGDLAGGMFGKVCDILLEGKLRL